MFPPGIYFMQTPKLGFAEAKKGTPYLYVEGVVGHVKDDNNQWVAVHGQPETKAALFYLSEGAFDRSFEDLLTIGFNGDLDKPALTGEYGEKGIALQCVHEDYEGNTQERFYVVNRSGGRREISADSMRSVRTRMTNRNRNANAPAAPGAERPPFDPTATAAAQPPSGDDIPF